MLFQKLTLSDFTPGVIVSLATCQKIRPPPFLSSSTSPEPWCGLNNQNYQITVLGTVQRGNIKKCTSQTTAWWASQFRQFTRHFWAARASIMCQLPIMLTHVKLCHLPNVCVWRSQPYFICKWSWEFLSPKSAEKQKRQQTPWFREDCVAGDIKHYLVISTCRNCSLPSIRM